jgi:hypothetical protein
MLDPVPARSSEVASPASLLRRYLQMYWLKPFDAVNDAANAWALRRFPWEPPILEVGGGDGVFSFVMHDGEFAPGDDRYGQVDLTLPGDIYDVYSDRRPLHVWRPASTRFRVGVDLKMSHLFKAAETGMYDVLVSALPEQLPLIHGQVRTVFLYTFHGLTDYRAVFAEIRRVIAPDGALLMIGFNSTVRGAFVCQPLGVRLGRIGLGRLARYFQRLDGGRYAEIGGFAHSLQEWHEMFKEAGFRVTDVYNQVSPGAWRIYDFQSRPILRALIRLNWFLESAGIKVPLKRLWVACLLRVLLSFLLVWAKPRRVIGNRPARDVFLAFRAVPIAQVPVVDTAGHKRIHPL